MKNKREIQGGPDPQRQSIMLAVSLLALLCVSLFAQPAWAGQTTTYAFLAGQSTITQTGGIAGIHRTYTITGTFRLTADFEAGTATFDRVDANAVDDSPFRNTLDPNEVFNMTELAGTIIDRTTIRFKGTAEDGSSILITLTFTDDTVTLKGGTTPPPNSADFFIFALDAVAQRKYSGGTGEPNDPYQIATAADLITLGETPEDYDRHFILTADIDLDPNLPGRKVFDKAVIAADTEEATWWFNGTAFTGIFDGNAHIISRLTMTGGSYLGLFGRLESGAEVRDLGVVDVNISGSGSDIGGLVGTNGYWDGYSGGLLTNCYCSGMVSGVYSVGGLVGSNRDRDRQGGVLTKCYGTAVVSGNSSVGGLVGSNRGSITGGYSTGTVTGDEDIGGLVGSNWGSIAMSYSTGTVGGKRSSVGGLVGTNVWNANIAMSYSTGAVNGGGSVGGLAGHNGGSIARTYSTGTVSGSGWPVGGLIGDINQGRVSHCYSTGAVIGNSYAGGLVGYYHSTAPLRWPVLTDCFWDTQTSGRAWSFGGTGKTTAEMQTAKTFLDAGWDFVGETANGTEDLWWIDEGKDYPRLWWER